MAARVQAFKSRCGNIYASEAQADDCDLRTTLREILVDGTLANVTTIDQVVDKLMCNAHRVWSDLNQFCKSNPEPSRRG